MHGLPVSILISMGNAHASTAVLSTLLVCTAFVIRIAADPTTSGPAPDIVKPDQPLIAVTMLPAAGQRQASAVAPAVVQVLRCAAAAQQQPQPHQQRGLVAPDSGGAVSAAMSSRLRTALSSAADTLHRAFTEGAPFRQGFTTEYCSCKTETNTDYL